MTMIGQRTDADAPDVDGQPRTSERTRPGLEHMSLDALADAVDRAGPRRWLLRGWWPEGDYGVHGAAPKSLKSWTTIDLAVSVASGTPWLGLVDVDAPGPVVMYAGEGSAHNLVRRIRAVCAQRGISARGLPITVCVRAPHLGSALHMADLAETVAAVRPQLVTIDPLYLSVAGAAQAASLYDMGALLERPQLVCQQYGAALWVAHHTNRREGARGADRMSGAGPAEWGRVLITGDVTDRRSGDEAVQLGHRPTTVTVQLEGIGGEISDQGITVTRTIAAATEGLDSPLIYEVEARYGTAQERGTARRRTDPQPTPVRRRLVEALRAASGPVATPRLADMIEAATGVTYSRETLSRELSAMAHAQMVTRGTDGKSATWTLIDRDE